MSFDCPSCGTTYYSVTEASDYLQVTPPTVNRWRRDGWLEPAFSMGTFGYAYTKDQLDQALWDTGNSRKLLNVEVEEKVWLR